MLCCGMPETANLRLLFGWKEIASAVGCSVDGAQKFAARNVDPLPVFYDFAERPTCRSDVMAMWLDRHPKGRKAMNPGPVAMPPGA